MTLRNLWPQSLKVVKYAGMLLIFFLASLVAYHLVEAKAVGRENMTLNHVKDQPKPQVLDAQGDDLTSEDEGWLLANAPLFWTVLPEIEESLANVHGTTLPDSSLFNLITNQKGQPYPSNRGIGDKTSIFNGQGFDKCEIPTLDQLQDWVTNSPYRVVNLYIGGSRRACANSALTASYVTQLSEQGWKFIPTWVGPQCQYGDISNDLDTAYNQGVDEANAAINAAANLGLTLPNLSGTIIYYDMENYTSQNPSCRNPAKSFIAGWTAQLHAAGNLSGVYGSSCAANIADFASISDVPDAIWPASWYWNPGEGEYTPSASVFDVSCIDNALWSNHQRILQYAGDVTETWGETSLHIDINVIDGIVADLQASSAGTIADRFDYPINRDEDGWKIPCHNCKYNTLSSRYNTYHAGEDWSRWDGGQNISQNEPVYATANGTVKYARDADFPYSVVIIEHTLPNGQTWYSLYGHLGEIHVSTNQVVALGDQVGTIKEWIAGGENRSHLHFEIRNFYISDRVNGANSASTNHRNYAPGSGYWPVGDMRGTAERPPDRGWTEPAAFIDSHRCVSGGECDRPADEVVASYGHFPDVDIDNTFYLYIETLYHVGAVGGYSDGYFHPERNITRGQVAKIIIEGLGEHVDYIDGHQTFPDVPPDHTFYDYIERMYELDITSGYSDGTYRADEELSRGAAAKFIVKARGEEPSYNDGVCAFDDVCPDHTFYNYIRRLKEEQCVSGYSDGTYRPDNAITRGEISKPVVLCLPGLAEQMPAFPDVLHDNTFFSYIKGIHEREIVSGFSDGFYRPDYSTTRGQAAKFIIRGLGESPTYTDARQSFPDVSPSDTFYHDIERMYELNITSGFSDGTYRLDQNITRAEVAKLIIKALGEEPFYTDGRQSFPDVPPTDQFYHYIERLRELNITSGYSDRSYKPDDPIDRGAMAKFTYLAFVQHAHAAAQEPSTLSGDSQQTAPEYNGRARYVLPSGDQDFVKVMGSSRTNFSPNSSYRLSTEYSGPNASVYVQVYNSAGSEIASSGPSSNGETNLMWTPPSSGTYYVKLTNTKPYATEGAYTYFAVDTLDLSNNLYLPLIISPSNTSSPPSKPDLVVSSLTVTSFTEDRITYEYEITNIGSAPANLDGPTTENADNVSVQAFLSQDTIFNNEGDTAAGGTVLGLSPLGELAPGESFTGSFSSSASVNPSDRGYLTLMVDWGDVVDESDETNNTAATLISSAPDPTPTPTESSKMDIIYNAVKLEDLQTDKTIYDSGETVVPSYVFVNRSDSTLNIPIDDNFSMCLIGVRQQWLERLGEDKVIPSMPSNIYFDGTRYAAGGSIIRPGSCSMEPGDTVSEYPMSRETKGFPAGTYRFYVDYKKLKGDEVIETLWVDFEVR